MKEKPGGSGGAGFKMVPQGEEKCLWMEAGVLDYKLCNNNFNCTTCAFDKAMKATADENARLREAGTENLGKKANVVSWQEKMKRSSGANRKCRHTLTGRAPLRLCPYDYECYQCEFDQMLEDSFDLQIPWRVEPKATPDGYMVPDGHFFHVGHTWARVEQGGRVRIGLDDFSTKVFGAMDAVDLPLIGEEIRSGQVGFSFKRGANDARVLAPVSGIVAGVNDRAAKKPGTVLDDPYNEGWLAIIEPVEIKKTLKSLLIGKECAAWLGAEHRRLIEMVGEAGVKNNKGGRIKDVAGQVSGLPWEKLAEEFLHT